jgi:FtsZ-interacting cell division protein ZipA
MNTLSSIYTTSTEFVSNHPRIVVGAVVIILVLVAIFTVGTWLMKREKKKRGKRHSNMTDDEELDFVIKSIHDKQKKNINGGGGQEQ